MKDLCRPLSELRIKTRRRSAQISPTRRELACQASVLPRRPKPTRNSSRPQYPVFSVHQRRTALSVPPDHMSRHLQNSLQFGFRSTYICKTCRAKVLPAELHRRNGQTRWITRNHIRKIKEAEEEWSLRADGITAGKKQSMLSLLEERGYVNQIVGDRDELDYLLTQKRVGVYCGVDPTAPSLHVGHMVPFMVLGWMYIHGYHSTFLLGGATSHVGDPTDRLKSREKVPTATRKANMAAMHIQLKRLGVTIESYADRRGFSREWAWHRDLTNNSIWWSTKTTFLDVLKVMGNGIRLGPMLGRDTVKNKLEKGDGMSFSEFCYPIMQAWDWWQLYKSGTQIQIGGADQFGNILAGAEAVKYMTKNDPQWLAEQSVHPSDVPMKGKPMDETRVTTSDPMGFTVPLLTTAAGEKFGKSAGNAIWLDKDMTSSFDLYQFFLRSADADVERYLKLFTFLPMSVIKSTMEEHHKDESKRVAQHKLAYEFLELVHGLEGAQEAESQHRRLFGQKLSVKDLRASATEHKVTEVGKIGYSTDVNTSLNKYAPQTNVENMGSTRMKLPASLILDQSLSKVLWSAGLVSSRSEGQRLINNRGAHIGSTSDRTGRDMGDGLSFAPITSWKPSDTSRFIIDGNLLILRVGKWKIKIIDIISDEEYEKTGLNAPGWKEPEGDDAGKGESYKEAQQRREEFYKQRRDQAAGAEDRATERRMRAQERRERPDKGFEPTGKTVQERYRTLQEEGEPSDGRRRRKESPYGVVTSATWE